MAYLVEDGQLIWHESGLTRLATIDADASTWLNDPSSLLPLDLLGFPRAGLKIDLKNSELTLKLTLRTEVGELVAPQSTNQEWELCVIDNFVIPITTTEIKEIWQILEVLKISLAEPLDKTQLFGLLRLTREKRISIQLPDDMTSLSKSDGRKPSLELLRGKPYDYQVSGIRWLCDYYDHGIGSILCDEMGLGKTYQALGLIAHVLSTTEQQILICAPSSLSANWISEIEKFLQEVEIFNHFGATRASTVRELQEKRIILTTYEIAVRDLALLDKINWGVVICDEAQALKNRQSQRRKAIASLKSYSKVLVTGTPIENSLKEL